MIDSDIILSPVAEIMNSGITCKHFVRQNNNSYLPMYLLNLYFNVLNVNDETSDL